MIPYHDHNPTRHLPLVNYLLIGLNVIFFLFLLAIGPRRDAFMTAWGASTGDIGAVLNGQFAGAGVTLLTVIISLFLHGGWWHLIGNVLFLWVFGDNVEDNFGSGPYLLFYLVCGIASYLTETLVSPDLMAPMIGASGAVAGVMVAYLILYPNALVRAVLLVVPVSVPAWMLVIIWLALQSLNGSTAITDVAVLSGLLTFGFLLGGGLFGACLTYILRRPVDVPRYRRREIGYARRRRREE